MMARLAGNVADLLHLPPRVHRTLQSCTIVLFCLACIVWGAGFAPDNSMSRLLVELSFATLVGSSLIYHVSGVVHEQIDKTQRTSLEAAILKTLDGRDVPPKKDDGP